MWFHKSVHSTGVSLDEASACWTFIPFELPIHPTAMVKWRVVINAYFSSDLVQFDRGGTTQNLGRIVPEVGADRPRLGRTWGESTRGGSTLGRIVCKPSQSGVSKNRNPRNPSKFTKSSVFYRPIVSATCLHLQLQPATL